MKSNKAARKHLDARFSQGHAIEIFQRPTKGWVKAIRKSLDMTLQQLAKRLNVHHSRIVAIEKDEIKGSLTLNTLEKVADALGCSLVYALVPRQSLETMVHEQALKKAKTILSQTDHTMRLEEQGLSKKELLAQLEQLANQLKEDNPTRIWDEP